MSRPTLLLVLCLALPMAASFGAPCLAADGAASPAAASRIEEVDNLGASKSPESARALMPFLRDPDPDVRNLAMKRLVEKGEPSVEPLLSALDDEDVRWLVSTALINIGNPAVAPTIRMMGSKSSAVRRNALFILRQLEATEAIPAMRKALSDPDRSVQVAAIQAIAQFGGEEGLQDISTKFESDTPSVRDTAVSVLPRFGPPGIATLTSLLTYGNPDVRAAAMREVGLLGNPEMKNRLLKGLADPSPAVRYYAVEALGEANETDVLPDLAARFDDADAAVREAANEAVSKLAHVAQPILFRYLREGNALQKIGASIAVRKAKYRPAVPLLEETLHDREKEVKISAVASLMAIGESSSVEALVEGLGDPEIRWICVMALRKVGEGNLKPLLRRGSDPTIDYWKQYVLDGMGNRILEGCLDTLKTEESTDLRMSTVCSMKQIKDTRAVYPLIAMLGDDKLGYLAGSVLAQMGEIAVEPLLVALKDENPAKRAHAAEALADIGGARASKAVRDLSCDLDPEVRKIAQRAAQRMSGDGTAPAAPSAPKPAAFPLN